MKQNDIRQQRLASLLFEAIQCDANKATICLFGLDVGSDNGFAGLSQFATYKDCPVETTCVEK